MGVTFMLVWMEERNCSWQNVYTFVSSPALDDAAHASNETLPGVPWTTRSLRDLPRVSSEEVPVSAPKEALTKTILYGGYAIVTSLLSKEEREDVSIEKEAQMDDVSMQQSDVLP
jgi:hypothetical protein